MHCSYLPTPVPKRNVAKEILDIVQPTIKLILIERIDALEMLKRERIALERRLIDAYPEGWQDKVRHISPFQRYGLSISLEGRPIAFERGP